MNTLDKVLLALNGIRARKLRSALTSLGIIIGAAAFVALVTLGQSLEGEISAQLEDLGTDQIRIIPGVTVPGQGPPGSVDQDASRAAPLSLDDEDAVARIPDIVDVHGTYQTSADVFFRDQNARLRVTGIEPEPWLRLDDPDIEVGRAIGANERGVAVLGAGAARGVFDNPIGVNQQIRIDDERFRVVGIIADAGSGAPDETIYVHREDAWALAGVEDELTGLIARVAPSGDPTQRAEDIRLALLRERDLRPDEQDFTITTAQELRERVLEIVASIESFLGSIAAVSLLVGGIGIANTMFMTVMERSRQIGILKALGMTRGEVIGVFLVESSLLGFLGGLLGTLLGAIGARALQPPGGDVDPAFIAVDPATAGGMILFTIGIGAIAGLIPAIRASSVPPVLALQGP